MNKKIFRSSFLFSAVFCFWLSGISMGATDAQRQEIMNQALEAYEGISGGSFSSADVQAVSAPDEGYVPAGIPAPAMSSSAPASRQLAGAVASAYTPHTGDYVKDAWKASVKVHGRVRLAMGLDTSGDATFTRAHADLNERNWRILSDEGLNHFSNTYDPAIYSSLRLVVDAAVLPAVSMHLLLVADPWSYTGKSKPVELETAWHDRVKVQYYSWGNSGYTINRTIPTLKNGVTAGLREIKVIKGNIVPPVTMGVNNTNGAGTAWDSLDIPEMKLHNTFQPVREAWVDVKPDERFSMRVFPMAYQDQAPTSDDPLRLSNNKTYWEESPWLHQWQQGIVNQPLWGVYDFTKGYWDRSLAFYTRDSSGQRLTALRGVTVKVRPEYETTIEGTIATPKTLWQNYDEYTALPASLRVKRFFSDDFYLGSTLNMHRGYTELKHKLDAENYVESIDAGVTPVPGVKLLAQASRSQSKLDKATPEYTTKREGAAYYASLELSSDRFDMLKKDYYALQPAKGAEGFYKTRLYYGRMEENFQSSLSNYHETRDDSAWSRNLTFYPAIYRNMPGNEPTTAEADQMPFAYGNGIDYGRQAFGLRGDVAFNDGKLKGLGDVRRVQTVKGKSIETVSRTQWTYKTTDKLTTELMLLHHSLPKTKYHEDPLISDGDSGLHLVNENIEAGMDPSMSTGAVSARYELTDWAAVNGVFTRTNDALATDNFPRGIFNSSSFITYRENGQTYRRGYPFLYSQGYFDMPPYEYHDIVKTGLLLKPSDIWEIYLDYTRNPNKFAGNIDDNVNHFGIETSFVPTKQLGFFARYTFTKWYDINRLLNGHELDYQGFNNVYLEARYLAPRDNKFTVMYGVGPAYNVETSYTNPQLQYYTAPVLSTQHEFRFSYEKKF
jgi:hypothetical protein